VSDPREVEQLLRDQSRRTTSRAELENRHGDGLAQVSPTVGVLDEAAVESAAAEDPDAAVDLLADLARATDPGLRAAARRMAAKLVVRPPRVGREEQRGTTRLATVDREGPDLDLDATLENSPRPSEGDLRWRGWRSSARATVLLVDASGSVAGTPLATAVTTAGALAAGLRPGDELGVVAFWSRAVVLRARASPRPASSVLDALLDLRGGSTTDLGLGLRTAFAQLRDARAAHREVVVLTDGAWNEGEDPVPIAARAGVTVSVLRTVDSAEAVTACSRLAGAGGGRHAALLRPSEAPAAVASVMRVR
jgi:Mg-chelatase subunit ChlD